LFGITEAALQNAWQNSYECTCIGPVAEAVLSAVVLASMIAGNGNYGIVPPKNGVLLSFSRSRLEHNHGHVLKLAVQTQTIKQLDSSERLRVNVFQESSAQRFSLRDL
jgi:hypothetical protein